MSKLSINQPLGFRTDTQKIKTKPPNLPENRNQHLFPVLVRAIWSDIAFHFPITRYARQDFHCKSPTMSRRTQKTFDSKCRLTRTGSWKEGNKTWLGRETESCLSSPVPSPRQGSLTTLGTAQSKLLDPTPTAGREGACEAPAPYISAGGRWMR